MNKYGVQFEANLILLYLFEKKIQFKKISNFKLVKLLKDDEEEGDTGELKDTFVFKLNDFLKWSSIALKISPLK